MYLKMYLLLTIVSNLLLTIVYICRIKRNLQQQQQQQQPSSFLPYREYKDQHALHQVSN